MNKLILTAFALLSLNAFAATTLKPMAQTGTEGDVANIATGIYKVQDFKIGTMAFKITELNSALNGDISSTTVLAVGDGGIGGEAGYDAAFLITPTADGQYLSQRGVNLVNGVFVFNLVDINGKAKIKKYRYDDKAKVLVEVP